ncbi:hypothetical protein B0A52_05131 [Exophiala mesophila]|uniref:MICOS complex subunit MIC12 n=1 Tax=Exophiala mesophila TaxID=212818 RepID=A0A438N726_EXOME|nr:hypothetical protein B0A52_05131 [Exophiala mesophila]
MGFTTGFLGGMTLTYSVLCLGLYMHRANRNVQKTLLSQQTYVINTIVEPPTPLPDPPAYEVRKAGLTEELKDRWNREIEKLVRNVQETDWSAKRQVYEDKLATAWNSIRESDLGKQVEGNVKEFQKDVKDKAMDIEQKVRDGVKSGEDKLSSVVDDASGKAKEAGRPKRLLEIN